MVVDLLPEPGQIVRVRSRRYLVEEVEPSSDPAEQSLVRLSCLEDDAQGEELEVLWEKEVDAQPVDAASWTRVVQGQFDPPRFFSAYYHTLRWNTVTSTDARLFQAPFRAGIRIDAYQLEPLRKALHLPRVNLFIADDVGLGKTIEAGLIVRELLIRQKVRRIVVAAPPSVVLQWQEELDARFGLPFVIFDRDYVLRMRQERGYGVNPWNTHSRFILSHALLREEHYAAPLRDWLGDFSPGSLLILDEAHNAAPASGARYAVDSQFTRVVRDVAKLFEHRLFLSATPHNGHSNSFAALLEILDPQRFTRGVPVKSAKQLDAVLVRRLKEDLRQLQGGFPKRDVVQVDIAGLPEDSRELQLPRLLDEYRQAREARLKDAPRSVQTAAGLVLCNLQKRLLSSIEAFASTLAVHRRALEAQIAKGASGAHSGVRSEALPLLVEPPGADDERAQLSEDEVRAVEEAQMARATERTAAGGAGAYARELEPLAEMTAVAEQARGLPDERVRRLVDWIQRNDRRVLIFTEWNDTKRYLERQLRALLTPGREADPRIATFHGGMQDEAREQVKRAFNANPATNPLRVLITTDAAREGVNLQNHCADLFHFDVPWNPTRMEQRNGRIDRKLQREREVRCHYFVYSQRPEDREAIDDVRLIGDVVISAFFGAAKAKHRERLRTQYAGKIELWLNMRGRRQELDKIARALREDNRPVPPFHWPIEFPEVFERVNGGFDAFVSNPPFLGGKRTSTLFGDEYKSWLTASFAETNNNADLVSFFFRRAFIFLRDLGVFGLIATNTIAQGDTRRSGLRALRRRKGTLFDVVKRLPWPGRSAVVVSVICCVKGIYKGVIRLNGRSVPVITAFLLEKGGDEDPARLNVSPKKSFIGCDIKGQGFIFDDDDPKASPLSLRDELLLDSKNVEIIRPYIGGDEINADPQHRSRRSIIDFGTRTESEAAKWPSLLAIVRAKVLPERNAKKSEVSEVPYWQFWRPRAEMRSAIRGFERVLVIARISQTAAFTFVSARQVLNEKVVVFTTDSAAMFAILQSRVHEGWARLLNTTLKDDMQYTPSDCFETFPLPFDAVTSLLERVGDAYFSYRSEIMVRNDEGLTKVYHRFHDPNERAPHILKLRDLHDPMDRAVLDAYGWTTIKPTCEFILDYEDEEASGAAKRGKKKKKPWRYRWPDEIRDEVLGRLLALNEERAREEALAGTAAKPAKRRAKSTTKKSRAHAGSSLLESTEK